MRTFVVATAFALLALASCSREETDFCPDDPAKDEQGACGCGVADEDTNGNGVPDCFDSRIDLCPADPAKTEPGVCGCGMADADANDNGVPDCLDANIDLCPDDPAKTQIGTCGCGVSDADANDNGVPDCLDADIDLCPDDPDKTNPGACGCGTSDEDANESGVPDCLDAGIDLCPDDGAKTQPGACGCGVSDADTNSNVLPDCYDTTITVAYVSEFTFGTGISSIGSFMTLINTSLAPVDMTTLQITDVTLQNSGTQIALSASSLGSLPAGQRTSPLSLAATQVLANAGYIPETAASISSTITMSFSGVTAGDQRVSFRVRLAGRTVDASILVHLVSGAPSALIAAKRTESNRLALP